MKAKYKLKDWVSTEYGSKQIVAILEYNETMNYVLGFSETDNPDFDFICWPKVNDITFQEHYQGFDDIKILEEVSCVFLVLRSYIGYRCISESEIFAIEKESEFINIIETINVELNN